MLEKRVRGQNFLAQDDCHRDRGGTFVRRFELRVGCLFLFPTPHLIPKQSFLYCRPFLQAVQNLPTHDGTSVGIEALEIAVYSGDGNWDSADK